MRGIWVALCIVGGLAAYPAGGAGTAAETMRLKGHGDAIFCVAISSDGARIVSGSNDKTAIVWDAASGKLLQRLEGHAQAVTAAGFSADGRRVVTGSLDHTARVWETESGTLVAILKGGHRQHVHGAAISPDGRRVLTASCDGSVVLWDVAGERLLERYPQVEESHAVAFSPDGQTFVCGCSSGGARNEKTLSLYDAATGKLIEGFQARGVDRVAYMDGGKRVLVLGLGDLYSLDVAARKLEPLKLGAAMGISEIAPSPDGNTLLVADPWGATLLSFASRKSLGSYGKGGERVRGVAIAPDGKWAVVAGGGQGNPWGNSIYQPGHDYDVKILSLPSGAAGSGGAFVRPQSPLRPMMIDHVAISADGSRVLTLCSNGRAVWWDPTSGTELHRLDSQQPFVAAALSADGSVAAIAEQAGTINFYDKEYKPVGSITEGTQRVYSIALSADGKQLFVGGRRSAAGAASGAGAMTTKPATRPATRATTRPVAAESEVHLFDLTTRSEARKFSGPVGTIAHLSVSADGKTLFGLCGNAYGGETAAIAWDVESGRRLWKWTPAVAPTGRAWIGAPALSGDGRTAAFGYEDTAVILGLVDGRLVKEMKGHNGQVRQIAFDPDGQRIWTGAEADALRAWDCGSGKTVGTFKVSAPFGTFRFVQRGHQFIWFLGEEFHQRDLDQ